MMFWTDCRRAARGGKAEDDAWFPSALRVITNLCSCRGDWEAGPPVPPAAAGILSFAVAAARAPGPPHRACLLHHHQVLPRRPCGLVVIRAALPIAHGHSSALARARCHDFLAATVTATLATTALATDTALSVTIVLPQDVQLHVLVYRPRCSACEGRGVRGLQDARGILGEVHTHGMVGHRPQLFVLASLLCASPTKR